MTMCDVKNSEEEICNDMSPTKPSELFDITLVIGDQKLYTARLILSCASPVWGTMFTSNFKEKSSSVLQLPGKDYNGVLEMLLCITPGFRKLITGKLCK